MQQTADGQMDGAETSEEDECLHHNNPCVVPTLECQICDHHGECMGLAALREA